jgi:integrase
MARKTTGIYPRHSRSCATSRDKAAACDCKPAWQAYVPGRLPGDKPLRRHFPTRGEAVAWRSAAMVAVAKGELQAPSKIAVREAADDLVAGMRDGTILNRSHARYKPSAIRSYERALRLRVVPRFGPARLSKVSRGDLQRFVDDLQADGLSGSAIRNTLDPVRVMFRVAARYGDAGYDPTRGLDVAPANRGGRDRIPPSSAVPGLVAALPTGDAEGIRALFAVAYRHGVRRGELRALRWSDVDLDAGEYGELHITRAWDDDEGEVATKTEAGERWVPLLNETRRELIEHRLAGWRSGDDLVFGRLAHEPFVPSTIRRRSIEAWEAAGLLEHNAEGRPLPFTLHEGRHAAVVAMRAAGIDPETRMRIVGHSSADSHERYARHVDAEHRRAAVGKLGDHLNRASGEG